MKLTKQILEAIQRGINLAIDDFDDVHDIEVQKVGQIENTANTNKFIEFKNKWFVDLNLPSKTLWGRYNIGVNPEKLNHTINWLNNAKNWYGNYYAWGELKPKRGDYDWANYEHCNNSLYALTKYCSKDHYEYWFTKESPDNILELLPEDDIAYQTFKDKCDNVKMPTVEQFNELLRYTDSEWVKNYNGVRNLNGIVFISKINGNTLFIPAAGYHSDKYSQSYSVGVGCELWSSNLYSKQPKHAYYLYIDSTGICNINTYSRCFGFSVRPVFNR